MPSPSPEETLDRITGDWEIFQLKTGHRFSTDDSVTAWTAGRLRPDARRLVDLGAGIGSVGLMTLHMMGPEATSVFVEVQEASHRLCQKTVDHNGLGDRVQLRLGDLRDSEVLPELGSFDLVTGSPPYFPVTQGVTSGNPQRAGARMELNGNVFDYCKTAAGLMKQDAAFAFVHAASDPRPEQAIEASGLVLNQRQDVVFGEGRPPTIAVFSCSFSGTRTDLAPLVMRLKTGEYGPDRFMLKAAMGF